MLFVRLMKRRLPFAATLIVTLAVMIPLCVLSHRLCEAANNYTIFERPEVPVTFSRIWHMATRDWSYLPSYNACINNLRQIDGAKQQWALENNVTNLATVVGWKAIMPYLGRGTGQRLWCPEGGVYRLHRIDEAPTCSIKGHNLP